jgi:hypothetical protein
VDDEPEVAGVVVFLSKSGSVTTVHSKRMSCSQLLQRSVESWSLECAAGCL